MKKINLFLLALLFSTVPSVVRCQKDPLTTDEITLIRQTAQKKALWSGMVDASIIGAGLVGGYNIFNSSMSRKETAVATTALCVAAIGFKYYTMSFFAKHSTNTLRNQLKKNSEQTKKEYYSTYNKKSRSHTPYLGTLALAGFGGCALYNKYFSKK